MNHQPTLRVLSGGLVTQPRRRVFGGRELSFAPHARMGQDAAPPPDFASPIEVKLAKLEARGMELPEPQRRAFLDRLETCRREVARGGAGVGTAVAECLELLERELEDRESPDGKAPIRKFTFTYAEALDLAEVLDIVLMPISEEEAKVEDHECLREMKAGPFPILMKLRVDLQEYLDRGDSGQLFNANPGAFTVLEKAIECSKSIGRKELLEKVVPVVAAGGGAALLLLLLL